MIYWLLGMQLEVPVLTADVIYNSEFETCRKILSCKTPRVPVCLIAHLASHEFKRAMHTAVGRSTTRILREHFRSISTILYDTSMLGLRLERSGLLLEDDDALKGLSL